MYTYRRNQDFTQQVIRFNWYFQHIDRKTVESTYRFYTKQETEKTRAF